MEFNYITSTGVALDDFGNEVRDESGAVIIVPENERANYDISFRSDGSGLNEFIVIVQEGDDEMWGRWHFYCHAEDASHAEEQALDHSSDIRSIAVYERVR
jgi:hypothetical protein